MNKLLKINNCNSLFRVTVLKKDTFFDRKKIKMILFLEKVISLIICYIISILPYKKKKFVILICSYNNESFFWDNINSALSQKYSNFRIIFINDNSSDKTLSFLQSLKIKKKFL